MTTKWPRLTWQRVSSLTDGLRRSNVGRRINKTVVKVSNAARDSLARMERARNRRNATGALSYVPVITEEEHKALADKLRTLERTWRERREVIDASGSRRWVCTIHAIIGRDLLILSQKTFFVSAHFSLSPLALFIVSAHFFKSPHTFPASFFFWCFFF